MYLSHIDTILKKKIQFSLSLLGFTVPWWSSLLLMDGSHNYFFISFGDLRYT